VQGMPPVTTDAQMVRLSGWVREHVVHGLIEVHRNEASCGEDDRDDAAANVRFAPKANSVRIHSRRQLLANAP